MKTNLKICSLLLMLLVAMIGTSCSDKDLYDPTAMTQKKAEYNDNFVKKYGEVDPNQSWDFSNDIHVYSLSAPKANARTFVTRADGDYIDVQADWYEVDQKTISWMRSTLKSGEDNSALGNPFYMEVPSKEFYFVPIWEGYATYIWTLHIVVDNYDDNGNSLDIAIWNKHKDMQQKTQSNPEWSNITENNGTQNATAVRVKPIKVDLTQFQGKNMYLYLENKGSSGRVYSYAYSLDHRMLALDIPEGSKPTGLEAYDQMIIGCEDGVYDKDYDDVVFMVYGEELPEVKVITEPVYDAFSKRYMVEDLGTTDDFDFNDIVVDVFDITSKTAVYKIDENGKRGEFLRWENEVKSQEAIVRSLGGTLDITVEIGTSSWTKSDHYNASQMLNTTNPIDYNAELGNFTIKDKDWDYEGNNVSITVGGKSSTGVMHIVFPKIGEVPLIVGFDIDDKPQWMYERQSVPSDWFTEVTN